MIFAHLGDFFFTLLLFLPGKFHQITGLFYFKMILCSIIFPSVAAMCFQIYFTETKMLAQFCKVLEIKTFKKKNVVCSHEPVKSALRPTFGLQPTS